MNNTAIVYPVLLILGLCSMIPGLSPQYHFVNDCKNWTEAQKYCREKYSDLASVYNRDGIGSITEAVHSDFRGKAWIGLERGDIKWHWSLADRDFYRDREFEFRNWKQGEPKNHHRKSCAAMDRNGKWFGDNCNSKKRHFICLKGRSNDNKGFILLKQKKTWREAQTFCRKNHIDLVIVQNQSENQEIRNVLQSGSVWIGLFSDPWKWSDHSNSSFRFWRSNQPNNNGGKQHCVAVVLEDSGRWNDFQCMRSRPFFCQGRMKSEAPLPTTESVKHTVKTTNEAPNKHTPQKSTIAQQTTEYEATQLETSKHTTISQVTTEKGIQPFNNATTNKETYDGKTIGQVPTPDSTAKQGTTEHTMISQSSQNQATSQGTSENIIVQSLTPKLPFTDHITTTEHPSTGHTSNGNTGTKYITTAGHTDKQTSTAKYKYTERATTEEARSVQDYLILIQENKTWNDALHYCREHHVNLVTVTTAATHNWVAKKAENASTAHVWLGLRFTCVFKFWFWITSEPGCYQNWANGHEPAGLEECGHTGAIESGGEHQWVSLPETDKLNFICYTCDGQGH